MEKDGSEIQMLQKIWNKGKLLLPIKNAEVSRMIVDTFKMKALLQ